MKTRVLSSFVVSALAACTASAAFDLRITEIWFGNDPGSNLSQDWFELTNYGDTPWTAATDGSLYFDDDSFDATTADILTGVASILPGESVVFVDDTSVTEWQTAWAVLGIFGQIGLYDGAGLGGGGDAVGIFLDAGMDGVDAGDLLVTAAYPDATGFGGVSYDVILGAFSSTGNGAIATTVLNDQNQPAVGSPFTVVPEPSAALLGLLGLGALARRKLA